MSSCGEKYRYRARQSTQEVGNYQQYLSRSIKSISKNQYQFRNRNNNVGHVNDTSGFVCQRTYAPNNSSFGTQGAVTQGSRVSRVSYLARSPFLQPPTNTVPPTINKSIECKTLYNKCQ